jgi:WD40 repeat protein
MEGHTARVFAVALTPDGNKVISGCMDNILRVWDLDSGETIAIYQTGSKVSTISNIRPSSQAAYGTDFGDVVIFTLHNLSMDCPLVTPVRIWLYDTNGKEGQWDNNVSFVCQWCGKRSQVSDKIFGLISAISRNSGLSPDQSPCFELPDEAWEEPDLLSKCPQCGGELKFNPFIVDNKNYYIDSYQHTYGNFREHNKMIVNKMLRNKISKINPNEPCSCQSGKKYKNCCGRNRN